MIATAETMVDELVSEFTRFDQRSKLNYHDRPELSRSQLALFARCGPRVFHASCIAKTIASDEESDAMIIGSFTHQQLLEPELLSRIKIIPKEVLSKSGSRAGATWEAFKAANVDSILIKQEDYNTAMSAVFSVRRELGTLIDNPQAMREREIFWTHKPTGIECRAKLDLIVPTSIGWQIPDIKTCASLERFPDEIRNRRLWLQHVHYTQAVKAEFGIDAKFWFAAVEKEKLFRVQPTALNDRYASLATKKYEQLMLQLARCMESNDWSDENEGSIVELDCGNYF